MLPEYDFTGAVRGKYYERYRQGTNVVLLDPDVAAVFRDSAGRIYGVNIPAAAQNRAAGDARIVRHLTSRRRTMAQQIGCGSRSSGASSTIEACSSNGSG